MGPIGLGIIAKRPLKGRVKTRLARDLGDDLALRIYQSLLSHCRREVEASRMPTLWFWDPGPIGKTPPPEGYPDGLSRGQGEGDLGERMESAARSILAEGRGGFVLIGTDCPLLTREVLLQAQEALRTHDAVLGPAEDGGYYLIGMKSDPGSVFRKIPWSTDQVASLTQVALENEGRNYLSLDLLPDIDFPSDWERFRHLDLFQGTH